MLAHVVEAVSKESSDAEADVAVVFVALCHFIGSLAGSALGTIQLLEQLLGRVVVEFVWVQEQREAAISFAGCGSVCMWAHHLLPECPC